MFIRLFFSLILLLLSFTLIMGMTLYNDASDSIYQFRLKQAHTLAIGLSESSLDALAAKDYELLDRWLQVVTPIEGFAYVYLSRPDGIIISHTDDNMIASKTDHAMALKEPLELSLEYESRPIIKVVHSAFLGQMHMANIHIAYFTDTTSLHTQHVLPKLLTTLLISILLLGFAVYLVIKRFTQPLESLTAIIEGTKKHSMEVPVYLLQRKDEIGLLARNFKGLMTRLSKSFDSVHKEKELNRVTLNSIGDAILTTDSKGLIIHMNPAAELLTGWKSDEAIGQNFEDIYQLVDSDNKHSADSFLKQVLQTGGVAKSLEKRILIGKDKQEYRISESAAVIHNEKEEIIGAILVCRNVTEEYLAEKALRRSQKMEAIGQLTGGIAHDFNNQLGIIIGYLDFLKMYVSSDKKPLKWVDTSIAATLRCMDLTKHLLSFSSTHADKKSVMDLNVAISDLEAMLNRAITPDIEIQYFLMDKLWLTAMDAGELQDALLNLVINARDAMPNGGKLIIETSNKVIGSDYADLYEEAKAGDYVQLMVSDTGEGMDKATLEHVFEPFFTTKPKGRGTGLGMSMVYGFVKRFGGFINIYSEQGIGTTFRIYIPRSKAAKSIDDKEKIKEKPQGGNETVLIVDDEKDLLDLATMYLGNLGYKTYQAENANQALEMLDKHKDIDMLFSDVVMPGGMNGYELAKKATELNPKLNVLLTSGFTSKTIAQNGLSRFTINLLVKPYRELDLAKRIRLVFEDL